MFVRSHSKIAPDSSRYGKDAVMAVRLRSVLIAVLAVTLMSCRGNVPEVATGDEQKDASATASVPSTTAVESTQETTLSPCGFTTTPGGPSQIPPVSISGNVQ